MRLTVVLPQGGVIHTGCKARRNPPSGYDLTRLCGIRGNSGDRHRGDTSPDRYSQPFFGCNHSFQGSGNRLPGRGSHDRIGPGTCSPGTVAARVASVDEPGKTSRPAGGSFPFLRVSRDQPKRFSGNSGSGQGGVRGLRRCGVYIWKPRKVPAKTCGAPATRRGRPSIAPIRKNRL